MGGVTGSWTSNVGSSKRAARGDGLIRGLAVDVSRTKLDYFLETGRLVFDASSGLDLDDLNLDFVALTVPRRGKGGPRRGVRAAVLSLLPTRG